MATCQAHLVTHPPISDNQIDYVAFHIGNKTDYVEGGRLLKQEENADEREWNSMRLVLFMKIWILNILFCVSCLSLQ